MNYKDLLTKLALKTVVGALILSLFFNPLFASRVVYAQENPPTNTTQTNAQMQAQVQRLDQAGGGPPNPQATAYLEGSDPNSTGFNSSGAIKEVGGSLLGCTAGGLLAQIISYGFNLLFGSIAGVVGSLFNVPVDQTNSQVGKGEEIKTSVEGAQHIFGVPWGASLNSIAYCIINSIITYVADATIAWANSGFEGSPAFLENPETFFEGLADAEASKFIQELAYNTTGINVCQPFRVEIALGLAESYGYGNDFSRRGSCSLDQVSQNFANSSVGIGTTGGYNQYGYNPYGNQQYGAQYNQYNNQYNQFGNQQYGAQYNQFGNQTGQQNLTYDQRVQLQAKNVQQQKERQQQLQSYWTNWNNTTQFQSNNAYGSYMLANDYMYSQIQKRQNTARFELGLNNGFLNFKKCEDPKDPNSCKTYTPGTLVQSSLEKSLNLGKDRLVLAEKFDQVVTAVVNNLIKVALNKILTNTTEENGGDEEN